MDIPNLSSNPPVVNKLTFSLPLIIVLIVLGVLTGYLTSRSGGSVNSSSPSGSKELTPISSENITDKSSIQVGKIYGDIKKNFKDTATGVIEKGSINGEGTHILNREGGVTQRAALTSSVVDLDLFIGHKVEVKGETNASNKAAWLLDVGSVKVLE
jgi:hypothetical protein